MHYFRIPTAFLALLLLSCLVSCEDEIGYNIPYVYVNEIFDLTEPQNLPFKSGNATSINSIYPNERTLGYAGIIIIKGVDVSTGYSKYYAFDQCCPVDVENKHKLVPDGATVFCEEHEVTFTVFDGSGLPIQGKSSHPLKPYRTSLNGSILRIYN